MDSPRFSSKVPFKDDEHDDEGTEAHEDSDDDRVGPSTVWRHSSVQQVRAEASIIGLTTCFLPIGGVEASRRQ